MKKNLMIIALGLVVVLPAKAQWTNSDTRSTISGVFGTHYKTGTWVCVTKSPNRIRKSHRMRLKPL